MPSIDWTAASTLVALGLGLLSIAFGYVLPRRRERAQGRRARLEVRYEVYWRRDTQRLQDRLVIVNHGPHEARDVDVASLEDDAGGNLDLRGAMVHPFLPATILQPGQAHNVIVAWTIDEGRPARALVVWSDGDGRHEAEHALSPLYV